MKRILIVLISLCLCFGFVACDYAVEHTEDCQDGNCTGTSNSTLSENETVLPASSSDYNNMSYTAALDDFTSAGFTNIGFKIIYDLVTGWTTFDGEIEEVLVNGSSSFTKGDIHPKDTEIIIVYHTWINAEPQITMPHDSGDYGKGWTIEELKVHFEHLGFTNIEIKSTIDFETFYEEGTIKDVEIEDAFLGLWNSGDVFGSTSLITISYYERTPTLTTDNCPDFVELLLDGNLTYGDFAEKYDDQYIEFDACVDSIITDVSGKTSAILVGGGNTLAENGFTLHLDIGYIGSGNDNIDTNLETGDLIRVIAKVDDYYTSYYKTIYAKVVHLTKK